MVLEGVVSRVLYYNKENGYAVLVLDCDEGSESSGEETVCGNFPGIDMGDYILVEGDMSEHPMYGPQLKATRYERKLPSDVVSVEKYLGSGAIKGIGAALAKRIVKKFKEDTFRIMEQEPERLAEVKGISERKAREIAEVVIDKKNMRDAMIFLQQFGISLNLAAKIYNHYGIEMYSVLKTNPYKMAQDIDGVGFKTADYIAAKAGMVPDSDFRIQCGMLYALNEACQGGHTFVPKEMLIEKAVELLEVNPEQIEKNLMDLQMDRRVIVKQIDTGDEKPQVQVYSSLYYYMELNIAKHLHDLNIYEEGDEASMMKKLLAIEKEEKLSLDELQKEAVLAAVTHGLTIITGGPGTGKTTTINTIIRYFDDLGLSLKLAAPTGRAAKRMTEATGYEAATIHRLLELTGAPGEGSRAVFARDEENPLDADAIIIDEMSMVDVTLMNALLKAIVPGTRLVLVGDVDQLPSVGPGNVLKDIINSGAFRVVKLSRIFRQALESDIIQNAHKINAGEMVSPKPSRDFLFVLRDEAAKVIGATITLVKDKLPPYVNAGVKDIQVLTPMRKGALGVENLNRELQNALNPSDPGKMEKEIGDITFREGDKVMQIKNNYQMEWETINAKGFCTASGVGVFNGDVGIIREMNLYAQEAVVEFDEGRCATYSFKQMDELELAYAVTIHKSQGSEYPAVVLPLLTGPRMLMNRNLLYTAVTRAKNCVTVVGSVDCFQNMIRNVSENVRFSGLKDRIKEIYK